MADTVLKPITANELRQATEQIQMLGSMFSGLLALAGRTEQLGRILNDEQQIRRRNEELRREAEPVKELIASADAAQRRLDGVNAEIARHRANMEEKRKAALEEARIAAEGIVADGRAAADKLLADARATAAAEAEVQAAEAGQRQATIDELDAEIATRNTEIANRQSELDRIKTHITELRAKIGA
jgi:DNA repair exonuclease SbcCD ATPase subunit